MKKISALILAFVMFLVISGCKKTPFDNSYLSYTTTENGSIQVYIQNFENSTSESTQSNIASSEIKNTSSTASLPEITPIVSSGSNSSDTPEPETPQIESPKVDEKNDVTTQNNNKLNETIESELGDSSSQNPEDFITEVWKMVAESDGATFSNKKTAKDTDTVSMLNLYDQPVLKNNTALETEILKLVNGKTDKEWYNTNIQLKGDSKDKFFEFAKDYYMAHGYNLTYGEADANLSNSSAEKYIWINITKCKQNKTKMTETKEYKYIQQAIKDCGITKGMLQKDAILKFNDYIIKKVEYDFEDYSYDLISFFERGKAICNSYSQVFELMCRTVGIDAKFVNGSVDEGPHAWNMVEFSDGSKYYFDICWNDSPVIINKVPYYNPNRITFATSFNKRTVNWVNVVAYMEFI